MWPKTVVSGGNKYDAPEGRKAVADLPAEFCKGKSLLMDRAYEATRIASRRQIRG
jgi:hypothetical protein